MAKRMTASEFDKWLKATRKKFAQVITPGYKPKRKKSK